MLIEAIAALAVSGAEPQVQQRGAPRGDYRQSCSGEYVNRGRLYADCQDRRGRLRETSIQLNRCADHEIRNIDGRLSCGPYSGDYEDDSNDGPGYPDNPGPGWPGQGRGEITVYRDAGYRGASVTLRGETPNLRSSGFNDVISSMRFRGAWEVCTDAYFRGRCMVIDQDVANLERWRLNDTISSMRPARGGGGGWRD